MTEEKFNNDTYLELRPAICDLGKLRNSVLKNYGIMREDLQYSRTQAREIIDYISSASAPPRVLLRMERVRSSIQVIEFDHSVLYNEYLRFLRAELFIKGRISLTRVIYSLQDVEQKYALRLDLEGGFIDHFTDAGLEAIAFQAAPILIEYIRTHISIL